MTAVASETAQCDIRPSRAGSQGPDLGLLAPFIAAFLAGHVLLALAWRAHDRLARGAWWPITSLPAVAALGALARLADLVSGWIVGLAVLGVVSGSLALVAFAVARSAATPSDPPAPP